MDAETIIYLVTIIVTLVLGYFSKKSSWINNKLIPLQNFCIGIISAIIYYLITKDFSVTVAAIGIGTGGAYDLLKSVKLLIQDTNWYKKLMDKEE